MPSSSVQPRSRRRLLLPLLLLVAALLVFLLCLATPTGASSSPSESRSDDGGQQPGQEGEDVLPLPAPEAGGGGAAVPQLKFGEKMRFDELGPIIVNKDGTTRRITNWQKMTKWEQERTLDRVAKRNKERMAELVQGEGGREAVGEAAAAAPVEL